MSVREVRGLRCRNGHAALQESHVVLLFDYGRIVPLPIQKVLRSLVYANPYGQGHPEQAHSVYLFVGSHHSPSRFFPSGFYSTLLTSRGVLMATQDKNLLVYNGGELQKVGATDKLQVYSADFDNNVAIAGTLAVTGAATLSSTLGVSGTTTLAALNAQASTLASLAVTDNATVGGTLAVTGAISGSSATLSTTLGVSGASTLASLGVTNAATVGGTLGVTGATTLSSTLAVTGAATLSSTLGVTGTSSFTDVMTAVDIDAATLDLTGAATVGTTLGVTGAATLSSTLGVTGATTLAALNAQASTLASLAVTDNATVGGTLAVTGASTFTGAISGSSATLSSTLGVSGASTLASAAITNAATVGGTLGVTGATTLASTLGVTGASTLSSATITNAATVGGTLGVTGATALSSTLSAGASTLSSATVSGALSAASASISGALSAGTSTLGNTSVGGTLGATGAVDFDSTLNVDGASTLNSAVITNGATVGTTLGVTGAATFGNTLGVTGAATRSNNLSVAGISTLTGAVTASSTLGVTGVANFANDVNVTGDLTVTGSVISRGEVDVIIRDAFLDLAFGDFSGGVSSGGFTVSMNKAVGFVAETVTDFTAGAGATDPSFTVSGATAFAVGDIVAITLAGPSENDGLFAVKAIVGSVLSIEPAKIGSAPFLQTAFVSAATQSAKAYKVDLAAVAVADGLNFPQAGQGTTPVWGKGTFVTLYKSAATLALVTANGAWESVGQVGLNEAYTTDAAITLTNTRNLVVNKPVSGTAAIQYTSNALSYYRTADAAIALGVWDTAGATAKSKLDFVANGADYDINLSSASTFSAVALNVSEQAKGGTGSWKVTDAAGTGSKGELSIAQTGAVNLKSYTNSITLDAGDANVVSIASDTMFKADFATSNYASLGYKVGVGAGIGAKKVVAASGVVAAPTSAVAANILGITLASENAGTANCCTIHGSLVQVLKASGSGAFNVGDVAYLAANGEVSSAAPTANGSYVMRVGYVVNLSNAAEPVIAFAPQFIAKLLA